MPASFHAILLQAQEAARQGQGHAGGQAASRAVHARAWTAAFDASFGPADVLGSANEANADKDTAKKANVGDQAVLKAANAFKAKQGRFARAEAQAAREEGIVDEQDEGDGPESAEAQRIRADFEAAIKGEGSGGLIGKMRGMFEKGQSCDCSEQQGEQGGTESRDDGLSQELKEQLKEAADGAKEKAQDAIKEAWGEFMQDSPLMGMFEAAKEEAQEMWVGTQTGGLMKEDGQDSGQPCAASKPGPKKPATHGEEPAAKGQAPSSAQAAAAAAARGYQWPPTAYKPKPRLPAKTKTMNSGPQPPQPGWQEAGLFPPQQTVRKAAWRFARDHMLPKARSWEAAGGIPRTMVRAAGKAGYCALYCGKFAGGTGMSYLDSSLVFEVLGAADPTAAAYLALQNMTAWMMDQYSNVLLRQAMVRALGSGLVLGTYAASEPLAAGDLRGMQSFGVKYKDQSGDYWFLNGSKNFVSACGTADMYLVAVRTSPSSVGGITWFLLPKIYPGMLWMPREKTTGGCWLPVRSMLLTSAVLRDEMRIGTEGAGLSMLTAAMDGYRLMLASAALGAARVALAAACDHLKERTTYKGQQRVLDQQALQLALVGLHAELRSARALVLDAAHSMDCKSQTKAADVALAKWHATAVAQRCVQRVSELMGAAGLLEEHWVNRMQRDLQMFSSLAGPDAALVELAVKPLVKSMIPLQHVKPRGRSTVQGAHDTANGAEEELGRCVELTREPQAEETEEEPEAEVNENEDVE